MNMDENETHEEHGELGFSGRVRRSPDIHSQTWIYAQSARAERTFAQTDVQSSPSPTSAAAELPM